MDYNSGMTINKKKKRATAFDLTRSIRNKSNYAELESLIVEADLILTADFDDDEVIEYLFGNDISEDSEPIEDPDEFKSLCAQHIPRELFDSMRLKNEDMLRERIIMNIIAPEINKRYQKEIKKLGCPSNGTNEFFEKLGTQPYPLTHAKLQFGVSESTLERHHRQRDNFKHKGKTHTITTDGQLFIYRDPPDE